MIDSSVRLAPRGYTCPTVSTTISGLDNVWFVPGPPNAICLHFRESSTAKAAFDAFKGFKEWYPVCHWKDPNVPEQIDDELCVTAGFSPYPPAEWPKFSFLRSIQEALADLAKKLENGEQDKEVPILVSFSEY